MPIPDSDCLGDSLRFSRGDAGLESGNDEFDAIGSGALNVTGYIILTVSVSGDEIRFPTFNTGRIRLQYSPTITLCFTMPGLRVCRNIHFVKAENDEIGGAGRTAH